MSIVNYFSVRHLQAQLTQYRRPDPTPPHLIFLLISLPSPLPPFPMTEKHFCAGQRLDPGFELKGMKKQDLYSVSSRHHRT